MPILLDYIAVWEYVVKRWREKYGKADNANPTLGEVLVFLKEVFGR